MPEISEGLKRGAFSFELVREGEDTILKVDCSGCDFLPSIEDSPLVMSKTIELLVENKAITKIVFYQQRNYEYSYSQTILLLEIARIYDRLVRDKSLLSYQSLGFVQGYTKGFNQRYAELHNLLYNTLKSDPIGTYVDLLRLTRRERVMLEGEQDPKYAESIKGYLSLLLYILKLLEQTKLLALTKQDLAGFKPGDRTIYSKIFSPTIKPDFMFTKLMAQYPVDAEELDSYSVNGTEVTIFRLANSIQFLYHIIPPEFKLSEEKYEILDLARNIIAEHKPKKSEFVDPERMRQVFYNVGRDLIDELTNYRNIQITTKEADELTSILVRYTVGFGLIEVLLQDDKIQDITINSPMGRIPMFIVHSEFDNCRTNIVPSLPESESWASKLRMISGRPLDEANPILDTGLLLPGAKARVAVIAPPLNPSGLAFAFRRHRDKPWTLPLFMANRMLSPLAAGIMSFLIDGSRTILVAGTRSAGKSSLLGAMMVEIMRQYRIITIEDTLELPTTALRKLGFNIQPMKVASAMTKGTSEVSADEGIRATLRLGDSSLIVGEVRSTEARALYEAMRVGALANVVAGTIHGDSPYGVYDRVVNDLNVPKTSFKATDVIIVANPIKSADGMHRWRRVTQITEVRKHWENDPLLENGFVDLMKYDSEKDLLEPTSDLINGEIEVLKAIAGNVKEWAGSWDAVWDNIQLRAKLKGALVEYAAKSKQQQILEAPFVIQSNDEFHMLCDKVKEEVGSLDSERIYEEWENWLIREAKKINISNRS
ncbi:MAG: type II/IV secretion system ATPase subunit [Candidatus Woesearchaeota archaeon]